MVGTIYTSYVRMDIAHLECIVPLPKYMVPPEKQYNLGWTSLKPCARYYSILTHIYVYIFLSHTFLFKYLFFFFPIISELWVDVVNCFTHSLQKRKLILCIYLI